MGRSCKLSSGAKRAFYTDSQEGEVAQKVYLFGKKAVNRFPRAKPKIDVEKVTTPISIAVIKIGVSRKAKVTPIAIESRLVVRAKMARTVKSKRFKAGLFASFSLDLSHREL